MIEVCYINGDIEHIELKQSDNTEEPTFSFDQDMDAFEIIGIDEYVIIPKAFIKSIRKIDT